MRSERRSVHGRDSIPARRFVFPVELLGPRFPDGALAVVPLP